ncbi:MAG: DUF4339 domain-containing protein [Planctomycetes bacterium]|nr:DUF4339 domain-containing protein [Planctomycetota bacterium]
MAEKITVKCSACGKQFKAPAELAGKKARCPCGEIIDVPPKGDGGEKANWFYSMEGDQKGPVSLSKLKKLIVSGELDTGNYVWTNGLDSWQPAEDVELLSDAIAEAQAGGDQAMELLSALEEEDEEVKGGTQLGSRIAKAAEKRATGEPKKVEQKSETQARTSTSNVQKASPQTAPATKQAAPAASGQTQSSKASETPKKRAKRPLVLEVPAYTFAQIVGILVLIIGAAGIAGAVAMVMIGVAEQTLKELSNYAIASFAVGGLFVVGAVIILMAREMAQGIIELNERDEESR